MFKQVFIKNIWLLFAIGFIGESCTQQELIKPAAVAAKPDFSKYIAIGDSQTAGYANDGLYNDGMAASPANIFATQLKAAGGGTFSQPLFSDAEANGSGYLKLSGFSATGLPVTVRTTDKLGIRGTNPTLFTKYTGANNNFGITGMRLADITDAGFGNVNPYFERLLPNVPPTNTYSYQEFVLAQPYTFFSCFLGANDVLSYAASGGTTDLPTSAATFDMVYTNFVNRLTAKGQMGVLINIPNVSDLAYFNTITISTLSATVKQLNPAADIYINARSNADVNNTAYAARIATAADLLILNFDGAKLGQLVSTAAGLQPYGLSPLAPVESKYVLDVNEISIVKTFTAAYNKTIQAVATAKKLAFVDAANLALKTKTGYTQNGVTLSATYLTGGIYSLDGVHLTPRGYAAEANEVINAVNAQYGTAIKPVDISTYPAVLP